MGGARCCTALATWRPPSLQKETTQKISGLVLNFVIKPAQKGPSLGNNKELQILTIYNLCQVLQRILEIQLLECLS